MRRALEAKFTQHPELRDLLLSTDEAFHDVAALLATCPPVGLLAH